MSGIIKNPEEIAKMRIAGRLAADVLVMVAKYVHVGVTTGELNDICHDYIVHTLECIPAPLNYKGFPKSICTSTNHQVCHGIPGDRRLVSGDILNIDVTVIKDGFHGDTSRMFMLGKTSAGALRLVRATYESLCLGVAQVRPGNHLGDIGHVIQTYARKHHLGVVRDYCGHGIGRNFHEKPMVLHHGRANEGLELVAGMTFTIEPMLNLGGHEVRELPDGWTVVTRDHSLSAQWEHTVLVTKTGHEVLTKRADEEF